MTDRPILFSGPMVRAILEGRKTQTRRIIKVNGRVPEFCGGRGDLNDLSCWGWQDANYGDWITLEADPGQRMGWRGLQSAYAPGDRLWVREAWRTLHTSDCLAPRHLAEDPSKVTFEADSHRRNPLWAFGKLRPSMFMPRWASRLTLIVTDVRVQRLQDISEDDARAEGIEHDQDRSRGNVIAWRDYLDRGGKCGTAIASFRSLWDSLNAARAPWAGNPWVVAVTFRPVLGNIGGKA